MPFTVLLILFETNDRHVSCEEGRVDIRCEVSKVDEAGLSVERKLTHVDLACGEEAKSRRPENSAIWGDADTTVSIPTEISAIFYT